VIVFGLDGTNQPSCYYCDRYLLQMLILGQGTTIEPKEELGRWLGSTIDIGPAVTANILEDNGQFFAVPPSVL